MCILFFYIFLFWSFFTTTMFFEECFFLIWIYDILEGIENISCISIGFFYINNRKWIVTPENKIIFDWLHIRYFPWFCLEILWESCDFWKPLHDKFSISIFIIELFYGIIYTHSIDTHSSRLHLKLEIVNTWLIVSKKSCKPMSKSPLPWLHTCTTDKWNECRTSTEIDPTSCLELPDNTIDKRNTCFCILYSLHNRIIILFSDSIIDGKSILVFKSWFTFELLNKVWLPMQACMKCLERSEEFRIPFHLEIMHARPCHMDNLLERKTTICEIWRYTRTRLLSINRTTHATHIWFASRYEKWCKCSLSFFFSSFLDMRISDIFLPTIRDDRWRKILLSLGRWEYRYHHATLPYLGPIITRPQSTHDSIRRKFFPDNIFWYKVPCHEYISFIGYIIPSLFMGKYTFYVIFLKYDFHHIWYISFKYQKWNTYIFERYQKASKSIFYKLSMKIREIRSKNNTWFKRIDCNNREIFSLPYSERLCQGSVITYTEVSLIPDDDDFFFFRHSSEQYITESKLSFHFFRIEKGLLQTGHTLDSRYCPRSSTFINYICRCFWL